MSLICIHIHTYKHTYIHSYVYISIIIARFSSSGTLSAVST